MTEPQPPDGATGPVLAAKEKHRAGRVGGLRRVLATIDINGSPHGLVVAPPRTTRSAGKMQDRRNSLDPVEARSDVVQY